MKTRSKNILAALYFLALALSVVAFFWYRSGSTVDPGADLLVPKQSTDGLIAGAVERLRAHPDDAKNAVLLSQLYLQKVRETADASYYGKIDALMDEAEKRDPRNPDVAATRALVAMGRHDFVAGRALGEQALALDPDHVDYIAIVGDSDIELGNYEEAAEMFQRMMDRKPNFSSWSRAAYLRELHGDIDGAERALKSAIGSGSYFPENIAWGYVELGKLAVRTDLLEGARYFTQALVVIPDFPPALEAEAGVAAARGDYVEALRELKRAFAALPLAQYAVKIGDIQKLSGNTQKADQQYELAKIAFANSTASGVHTDMEVALFLADHDQDLPEALLKAEAAYNLRPSILGADTLAWALYKNGKFTEARSYSREALRLGEHDPTIVFHAALIEEKLGNTKEAVRLLQKTRSLNPNFSLLYADVAKTTLQNLTHAH